MSSPEYRLLVSPQAQQDIASILRYTGKTWGRNQLLIYRGKLDAAVKTIGPGAGLQQHRYRSARGRASNGPRTTTHARIDAQNEKRYDSAAFAERK